MGKKVRVVTKCGNEHVYDFEQEVETVEVVEENVVVKGSKIYFNEVPHYQCFRLKDPNEGHVCSFHLATSESDVGKNCIYFAGGYKVVKA